MTDATSLGERIRNARRLRGLTQRELAGKAGVSESLIKKLEQGTITDARLETVHKIAVPLRVPTSSLAAGPDAAPAEEADVMGQTWQLDRAGEAMDLALDDASGDIMTTMAAVDWKCWSLLRQGKLSECRDLATRWADESEPRISRATSDELVAWGAVPCPAVHTRHTPTWTWQTTATRNPGKAGWKHQPGWQGVHDHGNSPSGA